MRVTSFEVHNVMRVSDLKVDMDGRHLVLIGGENGQGKTSALTAVVCALCGKRDADWPEVLLKDGESYGKVRIDLKGQELTHTDEAVYVELELTRKRSGGVIDEVTIVDSTGEPSGSPRALLKELFGLRGFDPLEFDRQKPKDKVETLKALLNLDFSDLETEYREKYEERTAVNRDLKQVEASLSRLDGVEIPADTPDEPVDPADLMQELDEAREANIQNLTFHKKVDDLADKITNAEKSSIDLQVQVKRLQMQIAETDKWIEENKPKLEEMKSELDSLQDIDTDEIENRIRSVGRVNEQVRVKQDKARLAKEIAAAKAASDKLSERLKQIPDEKQERLAAVKWPVPGMSVDKEGVLLNGVPIEQASTAERITASAMVQIGLNPGLRLMICRHGNDLDNVSLQALEAVLVEHDFQCILEFVTRSEADEDRCAVVLRDGKSKVAVE